MNRYIYRRISAFLIDMFLVVLVATLFSGIKYMNPLMDNYEESYSEYSTIYKESSSDLLKSTSFSAINKFAKKIGKAIYKLDLTTSLTNVYYLIFYFLYFVVFAYFTDGQTIGKRMFKLRVVGNDGKKVKFSSLFLRGLVSGNTLFIGVNIMVIIELLCLLLPQNEIYIYATAIVSMISYIIEIIALVLLFTKSHRSLDDYVGKTKVVDEVNYV